MVLTGTAVGQQTVAENSVTLDLYSFDQNDNGGNPLMAEDFRYASIRTSARLRLNEEESFRYAATFATIENALPAPVPPTVGNAATTSASADLTTLDLLVAMDTKRRGSPWTLSPGIYYHQQIDDISGGVDLGGSRELYDGDTQISYNYSFRYDFLERLYWDGSDRGAGDRYSHNLLLGWTEFVNPSLKTNLGIQYTRQDGQLFDTYNFVALYAGGVPVLYDDERLPNYRNRTQVNGRLRYSWELGESVGLDSSYYHDDWDIGHFAVEPSFETRVFDTLVWRVWYRLSLQDGTKYFNGQPTAASRFQTQDSDLGTFTMHSPGTTVTFRVGQREETDYFVRLSVYGFDRDDGVDGLGGKIGMVVNW